ncbi:hypothetical protein SEA_SONALI_73 [Arthrobacter phage Sonali]|uniref:Uncharacterized protein n=1 Tax=Arthrobacter phage Sonali TaxID=2510495 RepID=A0A411CQI5_9CAUD|nr:hypothetical protein HOV09_gp73 [Arthrobacter phage Sonali]QAY16185.1 hypothetical protein SEA_SONALI_73 [Arthrobacter phage Sonali]
MSIQSAPYYWYECDQEECGRKSTEGSDYAAWSDKDGAWVEADCSDWIEVEGKHYCHQHAHLHDPDTQDEEEEESPTHKV